MSVVFEVEYGICIFVEGPVQWTVFRTMVWRVKQSQSYNEYFSGFESF